MRRAISGGLARRTVVLGAASAVAISVSVVASAGTAEAATSAALKRYPYVTDVVPGTSIANSGSAVVNWATDRASINGKLTWGAAGTSCNAHSATGVRTAMTVNNVSEYQWTAKATGLSTTTPTCYRVYSGTTGQTDLLGSDPSPAINLLPATNSSAPYKFAVLGDWGQSFSNGNPSQDSLLTNLKASGAQFVAFTGDTGYPSGTQTNYGDLVATGANISGVFAPNFWAKVGATIPAFAVVGNHSPSSTFLTNWPETTLAAASGGKWQMENYPSINGGTAKSYPSAWDAFNIGSTRFYNLEATWDDGNLGTGTAYQDDAAAHWTPRSAEYQWLAADLQAHPGGTKFAFFHYPLYSDQSTEVSDSSLDGPSSLEGLLATNNVSIAFNGHAHIYERNYKQNAGSLVSYITGGGGATLQSVGPHCTPAFDAYAIGWPGSGNTNKNCGGAPTPTSISQVYNFLLVSVNGSSVTVTPEDSNGNKFDVQTYDFSNNGGNAPTAPTNASGSYAANKVSLTWTAGTDDIGVNSYQITRNGTVIATVPGYTTTYVDAAAPTGQTVNYTITSKDGNGLSSPPASVSVVTGVASGGITADASAATQVTTAATSWTVNLPSYKTGEFAVVCLGNNVGSSAGTPKATGWTSYASTNESSGLKGSCLGRVMDGSEGATVTVTWSAATLGVAEATSFAGVDASHPVDVTSVGQAEASTTAVNTHSTKSLTTVTTGAVLVSAFVTDQVTTWSPTDSDTEAEDVSVPKVTEAFYYSAPVTPTTYSKSATAGVASVKAVSTLLALRPA